MGVAMTHIGYWGSGLPKPRYKVLCQRLRGTEVEIAMSFTF
jgi:peptide methionine sulfoxide reductase MsrA